MKFQSIWITLLLSGWLTFTAAFAFAEVGAFSPQESPETPRSPTGVTFQTTDAGLQRLFDAAQAKAAQNVVQFTPDMKILVEGGGYPNAWIETQPMGGEMYAKRDLATALNNQLIFILGQRADGRLPGMVISGANADRRYKKIPEGMVWMSGPGILADYEMFQGYCFPTPAWKMYFWTGKDRQYLQQLYGALENHDAYLWRTRDSNGDGLLETWCVWDTGEDDSTRLNTRGAPTRWPFDRPPGAAGLPDPQKSEDFKRYWGELIKDKLTSLTLAEVRVPFASMDVMAYSYDGRNTLAKIARELGNGREAYWRGQADIVRRRLIDRLWAPERHACFDLDRNGRRLPELIHNNLRCMWHGVFTQAMADAFIREHLLNPKEFWTPVPLPSIAVNDPLYRSVAGNSWSGQPQGLTYQRAIQALENYGHYAEVSLIGEKLIAVLIRNGCIFPQQLDAVTGAPSGPKPDGYGPMILAALEYISRLHGVQLDVERDRVWWSALRPAGHDFTYTQRWNGHAYTLARAGGRMTGRLDGRELFTGTAGVRVVTDARGALLEVVGIAPEPRNIELRAGAGQWNLTVAPNQVFKMVGPRPTLLRAAPWTPPPAGRD